MASFYACLGVPSMADAKCIRKAFRKLSRKCHPEVNPGDAAEAHRYLELRRAHDVLLDPGRREEYDRLGHGGFLRQHPEMAGVSAADPGPDGPDRPAASASGPPGRTSGSWSR